VKPFVTWFGIRYSKGVIKGSNLLLAFYEIFTIRNWVSGRGEARGAEGKALSAGREQEETTAKQARPISVENHFMAIPPGLNIQTPFMRAGVS